MKYKDKELNTIGEIFDEALRIAKIGNQSEADNFLTEYIKHIAEAGNNSIEESTSIAKSNLGYFAGYYDRKTVDLIYKTYQCSHPIFGDKPYAVSPEDAFKAGLNSAK